MSVQSLSFYPDFKRIFFLHGFLSLQPFLLVSLFQSPVQFQSFLAPDPSQSHVMVGQQQDSNLSTGSQHSSGGGSNDHIRLQLPVQYTAGTPPVTDSIQVLIISD